MKKYSKILLLLIFLFIFLALSIKPAPEEEKVVEEKAEVESGTVHTTATIDLLDFLFTVYPEKRVPPVNNWGTIANFRVVNKNTGNLLFQADITTNNLGMATYILGPLDDIPSGNHRVYIKGISHLTKRYNSISFQDQHENFDFTPYGDLLAGDTNPVNDNTINSLDLSTLIIRLNTGDYINDLNQDTIVNSLDLSIQIFNLYKTGDT